MLVRVVGSFGLDSVLLTGGSILDAATKFGSNFADNYRGGLDYQVTGVGGGAPTGFLHH